MTAKLMTAFVAKLCKFYSMFQRILKLASISKSIFTIAVG